MTSAPPRRPWRLGPRATRLFDLTLAGSLTLGSLVMIELGVWELVFSLTQTAPLFWRRSRPVAAFAVVAASSAAQILVVDIPIWGQAAFPVALYSVARFATAPAGRAALGVGLMATLVSSWVWTHTFNEDVPDAYRTEVAWSDITPLVLTTGAITVSAWALGAQRRIREAYERTLVEHALMTAAQERARVAREMHDVVAHGLSVMVVQADGARYAAERDPDVAVGALETIATTGREALGEMRRLLGLLRGTEEAGTAPQPGLTDLPALLAAQPQPVTTDLPEPLPEVVPGVGLTLYRVVQESLTNVRKHAGPRAEASVALTVEPGAVVVEVADDGHGTASSAPPGLGLVGMRERVEARDGTLEAGPRPGGGWRVRARLPL
ncbi:MAG: sensor histidine kinase [Aeromicrobium sp.]|uniref:sensor histidine kinase n=1 Tax=Aeromicrobium sp. TaxID=1871063 RepID=UPI0039E57084